MKIAISSAGNNLDSPFESRFGRAPGFVIYDTETKDIEYLDNSASRDLPHGAGIQTAQMVADSGAQVLITGIIGPKASQALESTKLQVHCCEAGTVSEAVSSFQRGDVPASASSAKPDPSGAGQGSGTRGGGRGRGPEQGGRGMGGGARGRGPGQGGRGKGGGGMGGGMGMGRSRT